MASDSNRCAWPHPLSNTHATHPITHRTRHFAGRRHCRALKRSCQPIPLRGGAALFNKAVSRLLLLLPLTLIRFSFFHRHLQKQMRTTSLLLVSAASLRVSARPRHRLHSIASRARPRVRARSSSAPIARNMVGGAHVPRDAVVTGDRSTRGRSRARMVMLLACVEATGPGE